MRREERQHLAGEALIDTIHVIAAVGLGRVRDAVAYDELRKLVNFQIKGGISGLVPVGTTGESPTVSPEEHLDIIRCTVESARGRVPVIAGTGSNSTREAMAMTKEADAAGADGFLQVAPYYNRPTQE